jgi:hypothetical protein
VSAVQCRAINRSDIGNVSRRYLLTSEDPVVRTRITSVETEFTGAARGHDVPDDVVGSIGHGAV